VRITHRKNFDLYTDVGNPRPALKGRGSRAAGGQGWREGKVSLHWLWTNNAMLTMQAHVAKTVSSCFTVLRRMCSIRWSVTKPVLQSLVISIVLKRLDYGSASLACLLDRLQSVLHATAWLIYSARKYDHITPLLRDLHRLRVPERIVYHLAVLTFRCQHGTAPPYTCLPSSFM